MEMSENLIGFIQSGGNQPNIELRLRDIVYLEDFGVNYSGRQDDYAAIINAINYAREHKLFIKLPNNSGYLRVFEDI